MSIKLQKIFRKQFKSTVTKVFKMWRISKTKQKTHHHLHLYKISAGTSNLVSNSGGVDGLITKGLIVHDA